MASAEEIHRRLEPKTIHEQVFPDFAQHQRIHRPEMFVASIPQARFWGYYGGSIISPDDKILADVSLDVRGIEMHTAFRRIKLPKVTSLSGLTCVITTPEAEQTYGHWLLDALPRFALLQRAGVDFSSLNRFVVNYSNSTGALAARQRETLELFDIPWERVIRATPRLHLRSDCLIFPSLTTHSIRDISSGVTRMIQEAVPRAEQIPLKGNRLYITRGDVPFRSVLNENEVIDALAARGFVRVSLQGLTLREQASVFRNAEAVVGVISSGLSNIVFCEPGTKVLEIFPDNFWHPTEWAQADAGGLDYYYMFASGVQPESGSDHHARFADCRVNLAALHRLLDRADL